MRYYLGPLVAESEPFPHWRAPAGFDILDLGTIPDKDNDPLVDVDRAVALFWGDGVLTSEYALVGEGDCRSIMGDGAMRAAWEAMTGYSPVGDTLAEMIMDQLLAGSDPTGQTSVVTWPVRSNGVVTLNLNRHSPVWSRRFDAAADWCKPIIAHKQIIYADTRKQAIEGLIKGPDGKSDPQFHLRLLDKWGEELKINNPEDLFIPKGLPKEAKVKHRTTVTDDFNRADSGNLGANWTETDTGFNITSNTAHPHATNQNNVYYNTALSSGNIYSQSEITAASGKVAGVLVNWQTGDNGYLVDFYNGALTIYEKGGSYTSIGSGSAGESTASADTLYLEQNGGSLDCHYNGVSKATASDSTYASNPYAGIRAYALGAVHDNFEGADLGAGPSVSIPVIYHHMQQQGMA